MERTDVLIIGAGLLGCFAARALSQYDLRVTVLEAREDVSTGVSRANTGILYAGYDTKPGTLKSALTVKASIAAAELCRELEVPMRPCGSLMIACGPRAEGVLRKKLADGIENGVPGLAMLTGSELRALEPNLTPAVTAGLYAPLAAAVDPWALCIAAFENARSNGADFRFREPVEAIARTEDGFLVETPQQSYRAKTVLNCAGLSADRVRELCEKTPLVRIFPSAADYLVLDTGAGDFVKHIIFHEPERKGKGLTLVPTADGNLLVGPTERDVTDAPGAVTAEGLAALRELCGEVVPGLDLSRTIRSFSALRPNPYYVREANGQWLPEERSIGNFTVLEEAGLFSLIGIKTPGLTCACELGKYAAEKLISYLGGAAKKSDFDPHRSAIPRPTGMDAETRGAFLRENPAYGRILCRCRSVSEGEALEAIRRGAVTLDGVKRRTGAGMGRCQGGFCQKKLLTLLSRETGLPPERIALDAPGSEPLFGPLHPGNG